MIETYSLLMIMSLMMNGDVGYRFKKNYLDEDNRTLSTFSIFTGEQTKHSVISVHGISEHSSTFSNLQSFLSNNNVDLLSYDINGFGESVEKNVGIPAWNKQLLNKIDYVINSSDNTHITLIGNSMGAAIILHNYMKLKKYIHNKTGSYPTVILISPGVIEHHSVYTPLKYILKTFNFNIYYDLLPQFKVSNSSDQNTIRYNDKLIRHYINSNTLYHSINIMESGFNNIMKLGGDDNIHILYPDNDLPILNDWETALPYTHTIKYNNSYHLLLNSNELIMNDILNIITETTNSQ
jgi:alpha-beta hydrolase superfamily lysophospholipase